jgi:replicative DNA helicase
MPEGKIAPFSEGAEAAVLGSILIDGGALIKVVDLLSPSDFYIPANGYIYAAAVQLYSKAQPVDLVTVTNLLKERDELQKVGGSGYLAELTNRVATASHIDHHAKVVKDMHVRRELISASARIAENAFVLTRDMETMMDEVERTVINITQQSLPKNFVSVTDELPETIERMNRLSDHKGMLRGVPTGFVGLDNKLSGLQKSDLIILGARPSLGKTTLALDIAKHAATKGNSTVGIFSLEMSREQVVDRLVANEANVPLWHIRTGRVSEDEQAQIVHACDNLSHAKIFIDDTPSPNVLQMKAMARRLQMEHGLDLIVVDYLQLIASRRNSDNMVAQVTEISRSLKGLARELDVPVLALSQLSRAVDQRDNKKPQLHDLRESGSIEQDADVVIFIHRERYKENAAPGEDPSIATLIVAKHRNGPLGEIKVRFDEERVSFKNLDEVHAPPADDTFSF